MATKRYSAYVKEYPAWRDPKMFSIFFWTFFWGFMAGAVFVIAVVYN